MATRTRLDLVTAAMLELGLIAPDEAVEAEDYDTIGSRYDELLEELRDKGLVYWAANDIPYVAFGALSRVLAGRIAPAYGVQEPTMQDDDGRQVAMSYKGLKDLRRHMSKKTSGEPVRGSFF